MNSYLLLKNTVWMAVGYGIRLVLQFGYFVLVARGLGPEEYGAFAGVLGLASVIGPFASWGSGSILIKHVSRDISAFRRYWGSAVATTFWGGSVFTIVSVIISLLLFGPRVAFHLAFPISIGDLLGLRLAEVAGQAFQAHQRLSLTSFIWMLASAIRVSMAALFLFLPFAKTAELWALLYMLSGLVIGLLGYILVLRSLGRGEWSLLPVLNEWKEGFYFSLGIVSQGAYNDLDKTLMSIFVGGQATGAYTAAYRILDAGFTPVRALLSASYPRFFQEGLRGLGHARIFAFRLLPWTLGLSVLTSLSLALASPFIPSLLGPGFSLASRILIYLLPILFLRSMHYLAADALTGTGNQGLRSGVQVSVAAFNLALNIWLIPRLGWKGAWISSILSDGAMSIFMWTALFILGRRLRK